MRYFEILTILAVVLIAAGPGDIVINEIMYNGPESGADNEWIELYNTTGSAITLDSSWGITDGEGTYLFEGIDIDADGFLTIMVNVHDSVPFPFTPDIDATLCGIGLSNSGEEINLLEGMVEIDGVDYDDDWGADGDGPSLERIDPLGPSNSEMNWGPSTPDGGTPGVENSIYSSGGDYPPDVTDIMNTPENPIDGDTVTVTANITDDGTITKAMCFFSVDDGPEDSLDMADDGAHGDGPAGDDIWGAMIDPQPVGSHVHYYLVVEDDSLYSDTSWTYAYFITSGDTVDGNVVVNEIMYNPASPMSDNYYEYIELFNRGSSSFNISNWIVKDDNDFNTFVIPAGTNLGPGNYIVLGVNPDSIEAHYGITDVLGPVDFNLNNTGDAVRLYNPLGTLMDYVHFSDAEPWPTEPDGNGPSLSLLNASFDNNDPASWEASSGVGTPGALNTSVEEKPARPEEFAMLQLSPNPFNSMTKLTFYLPGGARTTVEIFDISGRLISKIEPGYLPAGKQEIYLDFGDAGSGIYLVRLRCDNSESLERILLIK